MADGHESIGKRLWGAVRPTLGTVTLYIVYESPLTEFQRFLHFLCGLRRPCSCASTAVGHDTNFLDHLTKFWEENTDWIRRAMPRGGLGRTDNAGLVTQVKRRFSRAMDELRQLTVMHA